MGDHDWLGIAVGALGILFGGYFYLKNKHKLQITYSMDKTQLLGRERGVIPEEVTILYKDVKITDLVKFNAIFWNSGNEPIIRQDIIEPILLCFSATSNLLKASVLKCSRPQNRVILHPVNDTRKTQVDFEYLEPRQGFNLELLITGEITDDPIPTGTILRMPGGFKKFDEKNRRPIADIFMLLSSIIVIGGFVFTQKVLNINNGLVTIIPILLMALITAFGTLWPLGIFRRRGIPQDLRT